jgi:hypothetical protein
MASSELVVVGHFGVIRVPVFPYEAKAVLVIDPNTVLSCARTLQSLESGAWGTEIVQALCRVKLEQLPNRNFLDGLELPRCDFVEDLFGLRVPKRAYHLFIYRIPINGKGQ